MGTTSCHLTLNARTLCSHGCGRLLIYVCQKSLTIRALRWTFGRHAGRTASHILPVRRIGSLKSSAIASMRRLARAMVWHLLHQVRHPVQCLLHLLPLVRIAYPLDLVVLTPGASKANLIYGAQTKAKKGHVLRLFAKLCPLRACRSELAELTLGASKEGLRNGAQAKAQMGLVLRPSANFHHCLLI